jgi:hypothetical protein
MSTASDMMDDAELTRLLEESPYVAYDFVSHFGCMEGAWNINVYDADKTRTRLDDLSESQHKLVEAYADAHPEKRVHICGCTGTQFPTAASTGART